MSCEHDCKTPPPFPKRIFNRPGLDRIDHRIGGYTEMRAHIFALIDADPRLSAWTHRFADDPGIALVESSAIVGDILTFYQSLYANEFFLRTAQWRESIADLVRLLGYRLAPGLAGESTFALLVKGDQPVVVPKGFGFKTQIEGQPKPVVFEASAALTAYPYLSTFNLYRPRVTPSIYRGTRNFGVVSALPAGMQLNPGDRLMLGVASPAGTSPSELEYSQIAVVDRTWESFGTTYVAIKGGIQTLRAKTLTQIAAQPLFALTQSALSSSALQIAAQPQSLQLNLVQSAFTPLQLLSVLELAPTSVPELFAYKLGASHRHFGHNAPAQQVTIDGNGHATTSNVSFARNLNTTTGTPASPSLAAATLPLDAPVDGLSAGTMVVVEAHVGTSTASPSSRAVCLVRGVTRVEKGAAGWGPQTGPSTVLALDDDLAVTAGTVDYDAADIRTINVHEVTGAGFRLQAEPQPLSAASGKELDFYGTGDEVMSLAQRALLLSGPAGELMPASVIAVAAAQNPDLQLFRRITLDTPVQYAEFAHDAPQVTVYGNLVDATQGKTEDVTVLGDGDNRAVFQTFPLPKAPLTYLLQPEETPPQHAELQVWVSGLQWTRVDSFFNAQPNDQVYVVREDADGKSYVQFGDGKTGAKLPSGQGNVSVQYRTGSGATGSLQAGTTPSAATRLTGLDKVLMPGPAVGGAAPEAEDGARIAAPGRMQSLGRLVSLADYEAEALAVPGVVKARATWAEPGGVPVLRLTVLTASESQADADKVAQTLRALDRAKGARRYALEVIQGSRRYVQVALTVAYDARRIESDMRAAILEALGVAGEEANGIAGDRGLFSLAERQFGQSAHSSQIIAAVQQVTGVSWVTLTAAQPVIELSPLILNLTQTAVSLLAKPKLQLFKPLLPLLTLPLLPKVYKAIPCEDTRVLALDSQHLKLDLVAATDPAQVKS
jgi:hypothetical protein